MKPSGALDAEHVLDARANGQVAILGAMEGGDGLEGSLDNLLTLYDKGLRLLQIVHFRANELGHIQTYPYSPGGLTDFGREAVEEANRLGIVIDLAHANTETIRDVLEVSEDPVIFSHGGLKAIREQDRALTDEEVEWIAASGGVVGIWPNGSSVATVADRVDLMEHVINVGGIDHVAIGSDLGECALTRRGSVRKQTTGRSRPSCSGGVTPTKTWGRSWAGTSSGCSRRLRVFRQPVFRDKLCDRDGGVVQEPE